MKTRKFAPSCFSRNSGFVSGAGLITVLIMVGVSLLIMGATMRRTWSVSKMNDRNNQFAVNANAAEAAVEKVVARMSYDFQNYGLAQINTSIDSYRTNIPNTLENAYWGNFQFSDGQNHANKTYVQLITNYTGPLPSQYPGRTCVASPVYRVLSNAKPIGGRNANVTGAVQVDLLAALVPITQWAIFYNGLLEFSSTATMTINGPVHANGNVYTGSSSTLTLNGTVTTTGTQTSPPNNGTSSWGTTGTFNGTPKKSENVPTVTLSIGTNMAAVHQIIEQPTAGVAPTNSSERARLYNLAQVLVLISNTSVTLKIQAAPSAGQVPGEDTTPTIKTYTNIAGMQATTNLPFLILTNTFTDQRENNKIVFAADIDLAKYKLWVASNTMVLLKTTTPTILYVANNRTNSATQLPSVRLSNGKDLPVNASLGFTVATPNPLYVRGNYNCPVDAALGTTDTSATVPAALMSDSLTILSSAWTIPASDTASSGTYTTRDAADTTVNAAILTGTMPSTGTLNTTFSGGVHNLPRLLEDWQNVSGGQKKLTLNTSILSLFASKIATNQFRNPGNFGLANSPYYDPPTRQFSYDLNFRDYSKTPPGIPTALVLIRKDWAMPPPNKVNYYAAP